MKGIVRGTGLETAYPGVSFRKMAKNPFRYFKTSPEIIQLAVLLYVRFPLSLCGSAETAMTSTYLVIHVRA